MCGFLQDSYQGIVLYKMVTKICFYISNCLLLPRYAFIYQSAWCYQGVVLYRGGATKVWFLYHQGIFFTNISIYEDGIYVEICEFPCAGDHVSC